MKSSVTLIATALLAAVLDGRAQSVRTFTIDDAWGRDAVIFRVTAPLEEIVGTTNEVTEAPRRRLSSRSI